MIDERAVNAIKMHLFEPGARTFAILDGASVEDLPVHLYDYYPEHVCLYRGALDPDMIYMAPYLALLERDSAFTDWILANGWGKHWAIFGTSSANLAALRKHFRGFLIVNDEKAASLYFRYYDPRVWRRYLPTCTEHELSTVFGPVASYLVEDEEGQVAIKFALQRGVLREEPVRLDI